MQCGSDCRVALCSITYERKRYGPLRNLEIDDETLLSLNSVADAVDAIENAKEA